MLFAQPGHPPLSPLQTMVQKNALPKPSDTYAPAVHEVGVVAAETMLDLNFAFKPSLEQDYIQS